MSSVELNGANLIAGTANRLGAATITAHDPRNGEPLRPRAHEATPEEVSDACAAAADSARHAAIMPPTEKASWLRTIADRLDAASAELIALSDEETALGANAHLTGELGRTRASSVSSPTLSRKARTSTR